MEQNLNPQLVERFVMYRYVPLSRKFVTDNIFLLWGFGGMYLFVKWIAFQRVGILMSCIFLAFTLYAGLILKKESLSLLEEFLYHGIFACVFTISLTALAVIFFTLNAPSTFFIIFSLCILLFAVYQIPMFFLLKHNIKKDAYWQQKASPLSIILPTLGGTAGYFMARFFIPRLNLTQEAVIRFLFVGFTFLAMLASSGIVSNFYKVYLAKKYAIKKYY